MSAAFAQPAGGAMLLPAWQAKEVREALGQAFSELQNPGHADLLRQVLGSSQAGVLKVAARFCSW